ncbi:MAG TPA: RNA pseudouridine synthase, partial [Candidatus Polarisedimenticolia bacterium]|nr:RNA pseudouridine synthase [Candidatus Polarisedimenticolia bacterium]
RAGDIVEARFDPDTRHRPRPRRAPTIGFVTLLEEADFVAVVKEPGLLTVPAPANPDDSLVDRLLAHYAARGTRRPRLWVVHRIDRFTSGLVLFARTEEAAEALIAQFARHEARREYLAICTGVPAVAEGRLESYLKEDPRTMKVVESTRHEGGRKAACTYRVEERLAGAALLRLNLETGRRNQIRVQLAGIGHPIVGDRTYGKASPLIARAALHAARLGFVHPRTGRPVSLESPLPADMTRALRRLRRPPELRRSGA